MPFKPEEIREQTHRFLSGDIGITNPLIQKHLVDLILLASTTSETKNMPESMWTDILSLDYVTGPLEPSQRIHIYGPPSSGKSALALNIASQLSVKYGAKALLADATFCANKKYIQSLPGQFEIVQTAELSCLLDAVGRYNVLIIDDFSCITDHGAIIELMANCGITNTIVIICNQIRSDMHGSYYARKPALIGMCTMSIYMKRVEKRERYALSQMTLERYRYKGTREGVAATLPIDYSGTILKDKIKEMLLPLAMIDGFTGDTEETIKEWIKKKWA